MQNILQNLAPEKQYTKAWIGLFILLTYFVIYVAFNIAATSLVEIDSQIILNQNPTTLLIQQGITQFIMFIVVAILITYFLIKFDIKYFFQGVDGIEVLLTIAISIGSMVLISAVGEWNLNLDFGSSDFAKWARKSEDQLKVITEHITNFQSTYHFALAILAVAIIPAISEELIFRGLIQNFMIKVFKNPHVSIWLTGFIFAAIHLQFFGLAPRMLLGVLFGYLYHWSGKLTLAMLGHFINNGLALALLFLSQREVIAISSEQMEQSAPWPVVLIFGVITSYLLLKFYQRYRHHA